MFGYYFFWTVHPVFPPPNMPGPGITWPMVALGLTAVSWAATLVARAANRRGAVAAARLLLALAGIGSLLAIPAGLAGPWLHGLDPTAHSYPAMVWLLAIWTTIHSGVGAIAQFYALARSIAGRATPTHDADIRNTALYHHFMLFTAVVTWCTIGLFPEVA